MKEIEVEFKGLDDTATKGEMAKLFTEYRNNAQKYAQEAGYNNYYEFTSKVYYGREYNEIEREQLRNYVKQYLVPFYREAAAVSDRIDASLSLKEYALSEDYLENDYESFKENYFISYFDTLPASAKQAMGSVFEEDRILVSNATNARGQAFVQNIGDTPICYFSSSDKTFITMSHEFGHYYAYVMGNTNHCIQDISEIHSTANELLFMRFLSSELNKDAHEAFEKYAVSNLIYQAISAAIHDEFHEIIFGNPNEETYTYEKLQNIMLDLIEEYDVADLTRNITYQLTTYWHRIGFFDVGYQNSYTISTVVAFEIYQMSLQDYDSAVKCYCGLVENVEDNDSLSRTLSKAGLSSPFEESTYKNLKNLFEE